MPIVRSRRRLARRRRRRRTRLRTFVVALYVAAVSLFLLHEFFHFADWTVWGLRWDGLQGIRDVLWPFFGAHDLFGYVSHAIVNLVVLAALGGALWRAFREGGSRRQPA